MNKNGFSLVELSIVLVILGLLTTGILTGNSLIRAAELRAVVTEFEQWQTVVHTYKGKYFSLPGDTTNATAFWGSANGASCNAPAAGAGTGTQTCNGNGDGIITWGGAADQYVEMFMFWQHLSNAGLIQGAYTGKSGTGNMDHALIDENVPRSKFSTAGWSLINNLFRGHAADVDSTAYGTNNSGWPLIFGRQFNNYELFPPALIPEDAWNIDKKIDDSIGSTGIIVIDMFPDSADCRDAATPMSYNLMEEDVSCTLLFRH